MAHLFIVSRQAPDLFSYLAREFSSEPDVTVILDRRQDDRRGMSSGSARDRSEQRQIERRVKGEVGTQLSSLGYAFVRLS
jgi:hypothetical protein